MYDYQAEDLILRARDIQLLRVTKEMQEYLRVGENNKQSSEMASLEKIRAFNNAVLIVKLEPQSICPRQEDWDRQTEKKAKVAQY